MAATPANRDHHSLQQIPNCMNCSTSTTPLWRRDENGAILCNACGLFLKLHGRPRPISLKTDVIKSRNRVKGTGQGVKRKSNVDSNGSLPAAHPETTSTDAILSSRRPSQRLSSTTSDHSNSPISRTDSPLANIITQQHPSNIAPQHLFDGVALSTPAFDSPSLPSFALRQPSPSASSLNGTSDPVNGVAATGSFDNSSLTLDGLKTRVSELELINGLFRGRVSELEASEQDARRQALAAQEAEARVRQELEESIKREEELKRRLNAIEKERNGDRQSKRAKLDGPDAISSAAPSPPSVNGHSGAT